MINNSDTYNNRVKWQIDCDSTIKDKDNVILSSPTGSGKTGRYEYWALNKPERPIFITSPIKALSNQKFRTLQANGYKVGLETGDIKYIPESGCDIICCTEEIYNNKYRNYPNSTLIIDEFSYIFEDEERSRVYIDSLKYSEAKNIMICSATFGNPEELRDYINKLTKREFFLYENKERLTILEYKGKISKSSIRDSLVVAYSKKLCQIIARQIYQNRINKIASLMGRTSITTYDPRTRHKKEIMSLAKKYNIDNKELIELSTIGVTYYFGSLYPKEKLFVEELFEKRFIDTVVGTDALSLGVNFPIQNVVFTQLIKHGDNGLQEISKNLFEQLSGRAGRKGYFDSGYVYYCDEFPVDLDVNQSKKSLKYLFNKLVNAKNEKVTISLNANIKDILLGNTTIEEEAKFITEFSTTTKDYEEEKNRISQIINYITSFDLSSYYLKKKYKLELEKGFYKSIEHLSPKTQEKIEMLSDSLLKLQPYFEKYIGIVYLSEYSYEQNCSIFLDVLMETPLEKLIKIYGYSLREILILRKYLSKLPEIYSKPYDLNVVDEKIDNMDYTILHPNEYTISKSPDIVRKEVLSITKKKNKQLYNCPRYLDKIVIRGKEYIKILVENNYILVSEYSKIGNLNLHYIPLNTMYKIAGIIKGEEILDILDRINWESLERVSEESVDKVEKMKLSLSKNKCKR